MIRLTRILTIVATVWLLLVVPGIAQVTISQISQELATIPMVGTERIVGAFSLGFGQAGFPAEQVLRFIERLSAAQGAPAEKESILTILAHALEEGLPIDELVNKGSEGLARGVPLRQIDHGLSQRLRLLVEVRDLMYAKGIFSAPAGAAAVPPVLPLPLFNQFVMHIADAIGDYLDGGGSPLDGHAIYQDTVLRLTALQGVTFSPDTVALVLDRLNPSDLAQIALAGVS